MKEYNKKIVIRVLNVISLIGNIYSIIAIVAMQFLAPYMEEIAKVMEQSNISIIQQVIMLGICLILTIFNIVLCKDVQKNKHKIALLSCITMITGSIYNIVAGFVTLIIIYKNGKDDKDETSLKRLDDAKGLNKWIYAILFIILFIVFYTPIVSNWFTNWNPWLKIILYYGGRVVFAVIPFFSILKRDIKEFISQKGIYIKEVIKAFSITLLFYLPITLIIRLIIGEESTNQSLIKEIPLWITAILAIIIAPISEEVLFRGFLRRIFKNETVFIVISALIFGAIHCMFLEENLVMYLYIIPYAIMGAGMAKLYAKTNNLCTNITLHFIWNLIVMGAMVIMSI